MSFCDLNALLKHWWNTQQTRILHLDHLHLDHPWSDMSHSCLWDTMISSDLRPSQISMAALVTGCKSLSEHLAVSVPQSRGKFPPKKICFGLAGGIFRSDILTHSICYIFGKPLDDHSATGLGIGSFAISNALAESDWLSVMGLIGDLEFTKFKDASKIKRTKGRLIFRSLQRLQENRPWQSHLLQQAPIRPIFVDSSISARDPPK